MSSWQPTIDELKSLFYQCKFRLVVEAAEDFRALVPGDSPLCVEAELIKAQALFEMHDVARARAIIEGLGGHGPAPDGDRELYVAAKLALSRRDFHRARRLFTVLGDRAESVSVYFRALLGLANVHYGERRYADVKAMVPELEQMEANVQVDERLSFRLLKALARYHGDGAVEPASAHFRAVISEAARWGWNYFIVKSLLGQAIMARDQGRRERLEATLDLLRSFLDPTEMVYLAFQVNDEFKDDELCVAPPLAFDPALRRIAVRGRWIALHERPLIYQFLAFLNGRRSFVMKADIAAHLWPDELYRPRVHDPRIFDLARRVRALIELDENQPVCLLSGRLGYRLAAREEQDGGGNAQDLTEIAARESRAEF